MRYFQSLVCACVLALAAAATPVASVAAGAPAAEAQATVVVHKSPTCGCCNGWVDHMRDNGFTVEVRDHADAELSAIKARLGVPAQGQSCHTAEVGGYVVEGHVPAADVKRLLDEAPAARGLVLPGMPAGSPGMEMPDGRVQPYTVWQLGRDGQVSAFARHGR